MDNSIKIGKLVLSEVEWDDLNYDRVLIVTRRLYVVDRDNSKPDKLFMLTGASLP